MAKRKKAEQIDFFSAARPILIVESADQIKPTISIVGQRYTVCCMTDDLTALHNHSVIFWPGTESEAKMMEAAASLAPYSNVRVLKAGQPPESTWVSFSQWAKNK